MRHEDKPSTPGEALKHHGVKGMRWGHRKKEETGGDGGGSAESVSARPSSSGRLPTSSKAAREIAASNSSLKRMMAASAELDRENQPSEAKLMSAKQDWLKKFEPSGATPGQGPVQKLTVPKERRKLTEGQKKLLKTAAIGAGVVGTAYLLNRQLEKSIGIDSTLKEHLKKGTLRGKPITHDQFNSLTTYSQMKTWTTGNYITKDSWAREAFELPVGHEFLRLSQQSESDFFRGTYSVASKEDWHRYLTNFRHEKGGAQEFHKVSWKLTEPVKVPALKDVIGTIQEVRGVSEKEAIRSYKELSGKGWDDIKSVQLINALKKKGYGAIIDEMDAGVIGDKPLVFFAPNSTGGKTSKKLTMSEIKAAEKAVKELASRKP
jgi:hypothetical protein